MLNGKTREDEEISEVPAYWVSQPIGTFTIRDWEFQPSSSSWDFRSRTIHGVCQLPSGYALCTVPNGSHVVELDKDQRGGEDQLGKQAGGKGTRDDKDKTEDRDHGDGKAMAISLYSRLKSQVSSKWTSRKSSLDRSHPPTTQLSSTNNFAKGLIAIFQTLYASFTLYRARGDQIQHYGYAAFGLTVVPYIVMSIINLASTILTPDYSVMYLVESEAMEEAKKRENAKFDGVVGRILPARTSYEFSQVVKFDFDNDGKMAVLAYGNDTQVTKFDEEAEMGKVTSRINVSLNIPPYHPPCRIICRSSELLSQREMYPGETLIFYGSYALALIPIAVNGALSHFKSNQSTQAQRVWTMMWLALGIFLQGMGDAEVQMILIYSVPAIGGFVVVCQMILQYGNCVKLG